MDLVAVRLTVTRQIRKGVEGSPKGGRRRSVPLTGALMSALKALPQVRVGRVVCGAEGSPVAEAALKDGNYKVCGRAGLPPRSWHSLRHAFATHAARFGVNPWRLQACLGHTTINMTMRYPLRRGTPASDPQSDPLGRGGGARSGRSRARDARRPLCRGPWQRRGNSSPLAQQHLIESVT